MVPKSILILKLGALGDVLRTTPLLRALRGQVTWITSKPALPLLTGNPYIARVLCEEHHKDSLVGEEFDLLINLEDDTSAATLASRVRTKSLIGAYMKGDQIMYTETASEWFDMSLISKFGKKRADELKQQNRRTYQDFLFSMTGYHFDGEEYILTTRLKKIPVSRLVGLETRAGDVWPMKRWNKFEALVTQLQSSGFKVKIFQQRDDLRDYVDDVNECDLIVCGDTLAMHIGLALKKRIVAIFTCTSPYEIYDYHRMTKIVSPLWEEYFYRRDFAPAPAEAISVESVLDAVKSLSLSRVG